MSALSLQVCDIVNVNSDLCYQCEKCSSGCPSAPDMEYNPAQIMHACQLGLSDIVFNSNTIWLCASCETCTTRCPQGIDISKVMDALRIIARREKRKAALPLVPFFYNLCLLSIKYVGCIYELGVAGLMRIRSGTLIHDLPLATAFIKKGKLNIFPKFRKFTKIIRIVRSVKKYERV